MLDQAVRPRLKIPTAPAPKLRPPGPVRRPILAKPAAPKLQKPASKEQRKAADTERSNISTEGPAATLQKSTAATQRTKASPKQAVLKLQRPASSRQRKADATKQSNTTTERDGAKLQKPASAKQHKKVAPKKAAPKLQKPSAKQQRKSAASKASATTHRKAAPKRRKAATTKLHKPAARTQRKAACPTCAAAPKSAKPTSCPTCGPTEELLRPPTIAPKMEASGAQDPAERQADAIGARIGASLGSVASFGPGPLPDHARAAAEPHLGVSLAGTQLRADRGAQRKAASESALAVTEGRTVSFAAGQFSSSTTAGRALIGHELTHVGQQAIHQPAIQPKSGGCNPRDSGGEPLIYDRWGAPPRPAIRAVGFAQHCLNIFLDNADALQKRASAVRPEAGSYMAAQLAAIKPPKSPQRPGDLLDVDCKFGPNTTDATRAFQAAMFPRSSPYRAATPRESRWDGKIGPKTWAVLAPGGMCAAGVSHTHTGPGGHGAHPSGQPPGHNQPGPSNEPPQPVPQGPPPPTSDFCKEHPLICGAGLLLMFCIENPELCIPTPELPSRLPTVLFSPVRAPNTPREMPDRISLAVPVPVEVTVLDRPTLSPPIILAIESSIPPQTASAGFGSLMVPALTRSAVIHLVGNKQSANKRDNLRITAYWSGIPVGTSQPFYVAAIPTGALYFGPSDIDTPPPDDFVGVKVQVVWRSDSESSAGDRPHPALAKVDMMEQIALVEKIGTYAPVETLAVGAEFPASLSREEDEHAVRRDILQGSGSLTLKQLFVFDDSRTGVAGIPVPHSGFVVRHAAEIVDGKVPGEVCVEQTITKTGGAVSIGGRRAVPGRTSPSPISWPNQPTNCRPVVSGGGAVPGGPGGMPTTPVAPGGAPATPVVPMPVSGTIVPGHVKLHYGGGLPHSPSVGYLYDLSVWYVINKHVYTTVLLYEVAAVDRIAVYLMSENSVPLNLAPPGLPAAVLPAYSSATVQRSQI